MKYLGLLLLLSFSVAAFTQDTLSGTINYQLTTKLTYQKFGKPEWDEFAKTLPNQMMYDKVLYFSSKASLYTNSPEAKPMSGMDEKAVWMANYGKDPKPAPEQIYTDLEKNETTQKLEFMTRYFIVSEDANKYNWRLTGEKMKVLDYVCMSAELIIEKDTIVAWFAPEIPLSIGPGEFCGLPGIILAIEKNGETVLLAVSIDLTPPKEGLLTCPKDGKKVTKKELDSIIEEKLEEYKQIKDSGDKKDYYYKKG